MSETGPRPLAVDKLGNILLAVASGVEGRAPGDAPLPAVLVALWHEQRVLMVFDRFRQQWELAGGGIESGESPRRAAVRELLEESGQQAAGPLRFVGYPRFALVPDGRIEYAALFAGRADIVREFRPNREIGSVRWWDSRQALPGYVSPLDAYLAAAAWRDVAGRSRLRGASG